MNFTSAAAIGGCGDDVLRGGLLIGRLLLQMFGVGLGRVLGNRLFGLQLSLTLGDDVVCLHRDGDENVFSLTNLFHHSLSSFRHHPLTVFTWLLLTPDTGVLASAITYCV